MAYNNFMGPFYVYHAIPMWRARVHVAYCLYCRYGEGMENRDGNGSSATGWDGPYTTLRQAYAKMATFKIKDAGRCKHCLGAQDPLAPKAKTTRRRGW